MGQSMSVDDLTHLYRAWIRHIRTGKTIIVMSSEKPKICTFCNGSDMMLVQAVQPWNNNRVCYVCIKCLHTKVKDMALI